MIEIDSLRDGKGEISKDSIKKIIPYGHLFLFVDKVTMLNKDKIVAAKEVNAAEDFFKGHFVGFPIMPGALIIEGIGQAGTLLVRYNLQNHADKDVLAYKIKEVNFKQPVFPGMHIRYEVSKLFQDDRGAILRGKVFSENKLIAEAMFVLAIVDKNEFRSKCQKPPS